MIDEEITFMEKGYRSSDLSHGSHKEVWAVCEGEDCQREGGRGRWVIYQQYRALCYKCAHKKLKLQHCETHNEKRECIDDGITFDKKGYRSTELKPGSHKEVWRVCAVCGEGRWIMFYAYSDLCQKCSRETDEFRKKMSDYRKGKNNPMYGMSHSDESKKIMSDIQCGENNSFYGKNIVMKP